MPAPVPQSNVEKYFSVIAGHSTEVPSEPTSRVEYYLAEIVAQGGIGGKLKPKPVAALPTVGESGILYLVPVQGTSGQNTHDEYFWVEEESKYELLGQAKIEIDLSDYALKSELPTVPTDVSAFANDAGYLTQHQDISDKVDKVAGKDLSTEDYTTAEKDKLAGIASGANKTLIDNTLSNCFRFISATPTVSTEYAFSTWYEQSYNGYRIFASAPDCANAEAFVQRLTELDAYVVYRLATSAPYQLTPAQLATPSDYI